MWVLVESSHLHMHMYLRNMMWVLEENSHLHLHMLYSGITTPGNPFAYPGINITRPFCYLRGKCSSDWLNQYLCNGEYLQSDLDIFQFYFMFVKPHDVAPLLYANVQTEMRFGVEQLLFSEGRRCKKELFYSKSHFSLHVSEKQRSHIVWFDRHEIELKYV